MNADLLAIRFLFASAGCLAAGALIWGVTLLLRRRLPALAAQRSVWLLAQLAIAATFVLLLAPQTQRLQVAPVFEVDASAIADGPAAPALSAAANRVQPLARERSWLAWAAWAWMLAYAAGLAAAALRLWQGQRMVSRLARLGSPLAGLEHATSAAPRAIEVDAPVSPMLFGLWRTRLIVPLSLREFDPLQQRLIIEHELTHWRRRDLWWLAAATLLQVLFWFNPAMRILRNHLAWSQELGCDRDVLRGRIGLERKAYAMALVAQLRMQRAALGHAMGHPLGHALAFGGVRSDSMASRLALIRAPGLARRAGWTRCAGLLGLGAAFAANLALQPALAWHDHRDSVAGRSIDCTIMIDAATGEHLVEQGACDARVTPASTFNIAVSLMGYDSGILHDAHAPAWPFKPGYSDWNASWRSTTDPTMWIRESTVWYAQQVAARLGADGVRNYVERFDYGNRDLSGDAAAPDGKMNAWFSGALQISPIEQTAFLRKVVNRKLGVSPHAYDTTAQLLRLAPLANGWDVYGKTGTARALRPDGADDPARAYGWFVGWASKNGRTIVFARFVLQPRDPHSAAGPALKRAFLHSLPATLDTL